MNDAAPKYVLSKLTGCLSGRVPETSLEAALESGNQIKLVDVNQAYPLFAEVTSINYAYNTFSVETPGDHKIIELPIKDFKVFNSVPLNPTIPHSVNSSIVIDHEIFTVVNDEVIPIWVADNNAVYYPDDIMALVEKYGYAILTDGL